MWCVAPKSALSSQICPRTPSQDGDIHQVKQSTQKETGSHLDSPQGPSVFFQREYFPELYLQPCLAHCEHRDELTGSSDKNSSHNNASSQRIVAMVSRSHNRYSSASCLNARKRRLPHCKWITFCVFSCRYPNPPPPTNYQITLLRVAKCSLRGEKKAHKI